MTYETKEATGALFKNDKKGNDRAPDYRGNCKIDGRELEISAWLKEGKNGKWMSLSFKPPYKKGEKTEGDAPW